MGGAVEGSNPSSDGAVALSNYIGKGAEPIRHLYDLLIRLDEAAGSLRIIREKIGDRRPFTVLQAMMAEWLRQGVTRPVVGIIHISSFRIVCGPKI